MPDRQKLDHCIFFPRKVHHLAHNPRVQELEEQIDTNHTAQLTNLRNGMAVIAALCVLICFSTVMSANRTRTDDEAETYNFFPFLTILLTFGGFFVLKHCYDQFNFFAQDSERAQEDLEMQRVTFRFLLN